MSDNLRGIAASLGRFIIGWCAGSIAWRSTSKKTPDNDGRLIAFLKRVADWPQPEVWYDPDDEGFVVDWSRDQNHFASVFFRDNSPVVRWGICTRGRHEVGCGQEITEVVMGRIKAIALDE